MVRVTPEVISATEILSTSTFKRSAVEQSRFLKTEGRIRSCKFEQKYKLQVYYKVTSCKL